MTNNTAAFNYLVASASDPGAFALETKMGFTGYFQDNSPIEAAATWQWQNVRVGFIVSRFFCSISSLWGFLQVKIEKLHLASAIGVAGVGLASMTHSNSHNKWVMRFAKCIHNTVGNN